MIEATSSCITSKDNVLIKEFIPTMEVYVVLSQDCNGAGYHPKLKLPGVYGVFTTKKGAQRKVDKLNLELPSSDKCYTYDSYELNK